MMRSVLTSLMVLLIAIATYAQAPSFVKNELIVQVKKGESSNTLIAHLSKYDAAWQLESTLISAPMRSYLLSFDSSAISLENLMSVLNNSEFFDNIQKNHHVKMRSSIPNDPLFSGQWQYINTGQSGGTPGADIDADLAWDITRGGVTYDGDTIVVCVLDDGIQLNHPDFGENLWVNREEIPNNNIDDDGNGYIDDYLGWSTVTNDDNVIGGGHGSPVAGITGARGNDGNGVAGVNWYVKIMVINMGFNTTESAVLAAYSYPLIMRQRYNDTQGQSGAFVVSTNASWGIDFGQPANAPLWCAFYDTLGKYGILNCGATINGNYNVDLVGDLPTACPSDHLISVTNMNHNDMKVLNAGYGLTTIDMGAFGQGTYTTQNGSSYGGFGGTSGATPHVAGAIALLYSLPCESFMNFVKNDPETAVDKMRSYILNGSDQNMSLQNITSTGGRLNLYGSMLEMINDCDSGFCPAPNNLEVSQIRDTSVILDWYSYQVPLFSEIRYRIVGDSIWNSVTDTSFQVSLSGLNACTDYEVLVSSFCQDSSQNESISLFFKTEGCCVAPENFYVDNILTDGFALSWDSVFAASAFRLTLEDSIGLVTYDTTVSSRTFNISGLDSCTTYFLKIFTQCDTGLSVSTQDSSLSTIGCGACTDQAYCEAEPASTTIGWVDSIAVNQIAAQPGNNFGYSFSEEGFTLFQNSSNQLAMAPGFLTNSRVFSYIVWVDADHDGVFDDNTERFFEFRANTMGMDTSFFLPPTALLGKTRLRVMMNLAAANTPCQNPIAGDVEDFCVTIVPASNLAQRAADENSLVIYPQPASDHLLIKNQWNSESQITVLDPLGRQHVVKYKQEGEDLIVDTSKLSPGLFILKLSNDEKQFSETVLIER